MARQLANAPTRRIVLVLFRRPTTSAIYAQASPMGDLIDHGSVDEAARYFGNVTGFGRHGDDPMPPDLQRIQQQHLVLFDPRAATVTQAEAMRLFGGPEMPFVEPIGAAFRVGDQIRAILGVRIDGDRARALHESGEPLGARSPQWS